MTIFQGIEKMLTPFYVTCQKVERCRSFDLPKLCYKERLPVTVCMDIYGVGQWFSTGVNLSSWDFCQCLEMYGIAPVGGFYCQFS